MGHFKETEIGLINIIVPPIHIPSVAKQISLRHFLLIKTCLMCFMVFIKRVEETNLSGAVKLKNKHIFDDVPCFL